MMKYDEWIKELSSSLISSGALQDEILLQCAAVCKLDVSNSITQLFLLFINDLPNVSRRLKFYIFADDTSIYYDSDTIEDLTKKVNNELKYVKRWLDSNKLSLNISKTNYIIFHSYADSIPLNTVIKIGKKHIAKVKYIKFLGVLLDEHLTWRYHISELSKKLARTCGILFKVKCLLPRSILIMLYNALFLSFVQYGIIVWGQTFASYLEPIFKLQKRAVRAISHQTFLAHSYPIFKELKLLRIDDVFKTKLLTFVYESINKLTPVYFHNFFCHVTSIHSHNTRQSTSGGQFLAQRNTLQYGLRSIRYTGAKQWNGLPTTMRFSSSKFLFKKHLKDYFLNAI